MIWNWVHYRPAIVSQTSKSDKEKKNKYIYIYILLVTI